MTFYMKITPDGRIERITYTTTGCKAEPGGWIDGHDFSTRKAIDAAGTIDAAAILKALGRFPTDHHHYATLAERAAENAIANASKLSAPT